MNESLISAMLLALPLIFAAYFVLMALQEVWTIRQLQQRGIVTEATITDLHIDSWRGTRNYFAVYEYDTTPNSDEGRQMAQQPITRAHFERLQTGQVVMVNYFAGSPANARLTGEDVDMAPRDAALRRAALLCVVWVGLAVYAMLVQR